MLTIRTARESDGPVLARIDRETMTARTSPAPKPDPEASFWASGTSVDDVLVAERDGEIAGYVMLRQALPLPSHRHVLEINGLAVSPRHQRQGVARELLRAAVELARHRGARKVSLRVLGPNSAARRLYEQCGFVVEGVLRDEFILDGAPVDDVLMALRLGDAAGF